LGSKKNARTPLGLRKETNAVGSKKNARKTFSFLFLRDWLPVKSAKEQGSFENSETFGF